MQFLATTKRSEKKKKRHQVSSSTSDRTCMVKSEEDGVNLKNVGSAFGLVSGDNPA